MNSLRRSKPTSAREAAGTPPKARKVSSLSDLDRLTKWAENALPRGEHRAQSKTSKKCRCGKSLKRCDGLVKNQLFRSSLHGLGSYGYCIRQHAEAVRQLGEPTALLVEHELLLRTVEALLELVDLEKHQGEELKACKEALKKVYTSSQLIAAGVEALPRYSSMYDAYDHYSSESDESYQNRLARLKETTPVSPQLEADVREHQVRSEAHEETVKLLEQAVRTAETRAYQARELVRAMEEADAFTSGREALDLSRSQRSTKEASGETLALLTRLGDESVVENEIENVRSAVALSRKRLEGAELSV